MRDLYYRQELHKVKVSNDKWLCKYCNKTFYSEYYLDMHFVNRHNNTLLPVRIIDLFSFVSGDACLERTINMLIELLFYISM